MTRPVERDYTDGDGGPSGWGAPVSLGSMATAAPIATQPSATQVAQAETAAAQAVVARDHLALPTLQSRFVAEDRTISADWHHALSQVVRKISGYQSDPATNPAAAPTPAVTPSALNQYGYTQEQADALITLALNLADRLSKIETILGVKG